MFSFQSGESPGNQSGESAEPPTKKKKAPSKEDALIKMACDHLKGANDDAAVLARGWSTQYNKLSTQQKIYSCKIISDVFFHGCLGRLNEHTVREVQTALDGNGRSSTPLWSDVSTSSLPQQVCFVQSPPPVHQQQSTIIYPRQQSVGFVNASSGSQEFTSVQHLFDSFSQDAE